MTFLEKLDTSSYLCMIGDNLKKVNVWCVDNKGDLFVAGIIFVTGLSGFGLGRLSVDLKPHPPLSVTQLADESVETITDPHNAALINSKISDNRVFISRNGSVYYYSWCSGAKRIKEENKVWFSSSKEAEQAGLKRASGCK